MFKAGGLNKGWRNSGGGANGGGGVDAVVGCYCGVCCTLVAASLRRAYRATKA